MSTKNLESSNESPIVGVQLIGRNIKDCKEFFLESVKGKP